MESEARYTLVGAAIVALAAAAVVAIVWLASAGPREEFDRYTIYFQRQSLEGLQVGADVTMLGVSIGRVEDYTIDAAQNRVQVTVRVSSRTPLGQTTTAVVQRNLLTGLARIRLVTPVDAGPGPPLAAVRPGERYPVIPEGQSDLDQIADAANRLTASGAQALDQINDVLARDNRAALAQTLANVRDITTALNARMDKLDDAVGALARTAADVGRMSREVGAGFSRIEGAVTPAAAQAGTTLADLSRAVARFERDTAAITRRFDDTLELGSLELGATARDVRATADILARTLDRVRDPRTLLFGPSERQLGPGERLE